MTTDDFATAARAEAREQFPTSFYESAWSQSEVRAKRALWESGAEWARTHLAAQEPTAAEVEAAAIALWTTHAGPFARWAEWPLTVRDRYRREARAALTAARTARRDEEKR